MINKGKWDPVSGYTYICKCCNGSGGSGKCPDCYGLDYRRIMVEFRAARGQRYYALLKAALSIHGHNIYIDVKAFRERTASGFLSPAELCQLSVAYFFPRNRVKPFSEWLEETGIIPHGAYRRIRQRGFKPMVVMDKLGIMDCNKCLLPYPKKQMNDNGTCVWCDSSDYQQRYQKHLTNMADTERQRFLLGDWLIGDDKNEQ